LAQLRTGPRRGILKSDVSRLCEEIDDKVAVVFAFTPPRLRRTLPKGACPTATRRQSAAAQGGCAAKLGQAEF
jgi:hypothetical protein